MSTKKTYRDIFAACQRLLDRHNSTCRIEYNPRGHDKFIIEVGPHSTKMTMACSPRTKDMAVQHKINDTRRFLRSVGLEDR